jgi:hypothetical protein
MTASTGFPDQWSNMPMPSDDFTLWSKANKFSGYRYAVDSTDSPPTGDAGKNFGIPVVWTNFGSAPAYEDWQPEYDILSDTGQVVQTIAGSINLRHIVAVQSFDSPGGVPASKSERDMVQVGKELPPGRYTVRVRVVWREHKPNASHVVNFPPMQLAYPGPGSPPVATFTIR